MDKFMKPSRQVIKVYLHDKLGNTVATSVVAVDFDDPFFEELVEAGVVTWKKRHFNFAYKVKGEWAYVYQEVDTLELSEAMVTEA